MNWLTTDLVVPIAEVLAEFDIMDLREGTPDIVDEYRPEAEDIVKRLQKGVQKHDAISSRELRELLSSVFEYWFETEFDSAEFEVPARKIQGLLRQDRP